MRVVIVLLLATAAIAQTNSRSGVIGGLIGPSPVNVVSFSSLGPGLPGEAITGAPYSAEEVTENVQTLADGTHITQPSRKTVFYRDSLGGAHRAHLSAAARCIWSCRTQFHRNF